MITRDGVGGGLSGAAVEPLLNSEEGACGAFLSYGTASHTNHDPNDARNNPPNARHGA